MKRAAGAARRSPLVSAIGADHGLQFFCGRSRFPLRAQVHDVVELERPDRALAHRAHETDSSPLLKRPAWDFSARASVSNHSAISSKPSSRAVLAKPGYISVYS